MKYRIEIENQGEKAVLRLFGELDAKDGGLFHKGIHCLSTVPSSWLEIDFTGIREVSSVFLAEILHLGMRAKMRQQRVSAKIPPSLLDRCREAGLEKVVELIPSNG